MARPWPAWTLGRAKALTKPDIWLGLAWPISAWLWPAHGLRPGQAKHYCAEMIGRRAVACPIARSCPINCYMHIIGSSLQPQVAKVPWKSSAQFNLVHPETWNRMVTSKASGSLHQTSNVEGKWNCYGFLAPAES